MMNGACVKTFRRFQMDGSHTKVISFEKISLDIRVPMNGYPPGRLIGFPSPTCSRSSVLSDGSKKRSSKVQVQVQPGPGQVTPAVGRYRLRTVPKY